MLAAVAAWPVAVGEVAPALPPVRRLLRAFSLPSGPAAGWFVRLAGPRVGGVLGLHGGRPWLVLWGLVWPGVESGREFGTAAEFPWLLGIQCWTQQMALIRAATAATVL